MVKRSNSLNLLYPPFLIRFLRGLRAAQAAGYPVKSFETFRTNERQQYLYDQGRSTSGEIVTRARPGRTYHEYGIAADVAMIKNGKWDWSDADLYVRVAGFFEKEGLQWLGRKTSDLTHYQLAINVSIYEIENVYKSGGMIAVWQKLNERYGDLDLWKKLG